jgi:hypothetical protein
MPGKGQANVTGNLLEISVTQVFTSKGFKLISYAEWKKKPELYGKELLLKNVPYRTIYEHPGRTEFLAISERLNFKIRIECKWQQSNGSVDEKFPEAVL